MSATTTQLLSSGEFCKLRNNTTPVKSASANVSFYNNNSKKRQILSCDTLVANDIRTHPLVVIRHVSMFTHCTSKSDQACKHTPQKCYEDHTQIFQIPGKIERIYAQLQQS